MKTYTILLLIFLVSACSIHKPVNNSTYWWDFKDSTNYASFTVTPEGTIVDWRRNEILAMDKQRDTLTKYKLELPNGIKKFGSSDAPNHFFFYGNKKGIFINRYHYNKQNTEFKIFERCDSLDRLPFWEYGEYTKKVIPDNGNYYYKCICNNGIRIYVYNFSTEETDRIIEKIKNSFEYIPYEENRGL